jgi:rhombotail lipoprotein
MKMHNAIKVIASVVLSTALLLGCASQQIRTQSSVVDYLYPDGVETAVQPSTPRLNIPIRVGIAFVPERAARSHSNRRFYASISGGSLTEADKSRLLERIADNFRKHAFVSDIEVIPSPYLSPSGSFGNLEQIRTMYGIDVIALVSYDQVQFTDDGMLSLTYWTIVGAYVVAGQKNDTNTMLDTAVYHIQSRKMLFRAPGISQVKGRATPVNLSEELRADSIESFEQATDEMITNLDAELTEFKKRLKSRPEQAEVVYRDGYSGGGALSLIEAVVLLPFVLAVAIRARLRSGKVKLGCRLKT